MLSFDSQIKILIVRETKFEFIFHFFADSLNLTSNQITHLNLCSVLAVLCDTTYIL